MELAFLVYALGFLGKLQVALSCILIVTGVTAFFIFMFGSIEHKSTMEYQREDSKKYQKAEAQLAADKKIIKRLLYSAAACLTLLVMLPSEKTAYTMVGAYAVQAVATHPATVEISAKVLKLINNKLDEHLK